MKQTMKQTMIAACVLGTLGGVATSAQADRYSNPTRANENGHARRIWARRTSDAWGNAGAYCEELEGSYGSSSHISEPSWALDFSFTCGEENTSYVKYDWDREDWISERSGSAVYTSCSTNGHGYAIMSRIRCGYYTPVYDYVAVAANEQAALGYCREAGFSGVNDYEARRRCSGKVKAYDPFWGWWYDVNASSSSCQLYITNLECRR